MSSARSRSPSAARSPSLGVRAQSPSPPPRAAGPRRWGAAAAAKTAIYDDGPPAAAAADVDETVVEVLGGCGMEELGVAAKRGAVSRRLYVAAARATEFINSQEGRSVIEELEVAEAANARFHRAAAAAAAHHATEGWEATTAAACEGASPEEAEAARIARVIAEGAQFADELEEAAQGQSPEMQEVARKLIDLLRDPVPMPPQPRAVPPAAPAAEASPAAPAAEVVSWTESRSDEITPTEDGTSVHAAAPSPSVVRFCGTCGQMVETTTRTYQDWGSNRGRRGYMYMIGCNGGLCGMGGSVAGTMVHVVSRCAAARRDSASVGCESFGPFGSRRDPMGPTDSPPDRELFGPTDSLRRPSCSCSGIGTRRPRGPGGLRRANTMLWDPTSCAAMPCAGSLASCRRRASPP